MIGDLNVKHAYCITIRRPWN